MKKMSLYFLFVLFSVVEVRAELEAVVIEVRKNTSLSKKEKVFKNYFINGGSSVGLRVGTHVDVLRRLPVHDPIKNTSIGDLRVKVGTLEVIHVEGKISVARLVKYDSMEERPLLDYEAVMVGDRLDLATIRLPQQENQAFNDEPEEMAQKVALLRGKSRAERLIQEGERHLANLEMKTKAQEQRTLASQMSANSEGSGESYVESRLSSRPKVQKNKKRSSAQRVPASVKKKSSQKKSNRQG